MRNDGNGAIRLAAVAVLGAVTLVASACGGGSSEESTTDTAATATETSQTSETTAPVSTTEAPDTTALPSYALDLLDAVDAGASLWALLVDLHGSTADVAEQMNRMTSFPAIPTPLGGAYVVDAGTIVDVASGSDEADPDALGQFARVKFLTTGSAEDVLLFYETSLATDAWSRTGVEESTDGAATSTKITLEQPDVPGNMTVEVVEGGELGATTVEFVLFETMNTRVELLARLSDWAKEFVPAAAVPVKANISSSYYGLLSGSSQVSLSTLWRDTRPIEDRIADIQALAQAGGRPFEETETGVVILDGPVERITVDAVNDAIDLRMITDGAEVLTDIADFDGAAVDGAESAAPAPVGDGTLQIVESASPLTDFATANEIESVVEDIRGPTLDLATDMARVARFPNVPTPDGAELISLRTEISSVLNAPDLLAVSSRVTVRVPTATVDDLAVFYDTSLAGSGWTKTGSEEKDSTDEGEKYITQTYSIADVESGVVDEPLEVEVDDEIGGVSQVSIQFTQFLPRAEANIDRWLGWQGDMPLPAGGEVSRVALVVTGGSSPTMSLSVDQSYPEIDGDTIRSDVEALLATSDYREDPAQSTDYVLGLSHPDFDDGEVSFTSTPTRRLVLTMRRDLS